MCSATICKKILPIIREGGSDTATFDNVLEFLVMTGRSLPHAILMMIPEPWAGHESMRPELKAFYEYHSSLMEPWDGPASIAFTDGRVIGAILDRNGLRPSRYYVTKDDLVIMASEVGVLDIPAENILIKERLHPGRIFLIDTEQGRIVSDDEIKRDLETVHPYAQWLAENLVDIEDLPEAPYLPPPSHETVLQRQQTFGYTHEDLRILLAPMANGGEEAIGSMGTDTSLAVLSDRPRLLYDYFKQLFAQVTNPPLDAIREELVTSMGSTIGPEGNLLDPRPESCRQIAIKYPVIDNDQLAKLRHIYEPEFKSITLSMVFDPRKGGPRPRARAAGAEGAGQRGGRRRATRSSSCRTGPSTANSAPIPSLLATAGVHHHLVLEGTRTRCALVVESGDAREVHHCALLLGYGAGVVNPYLAFETLDDMIQQRLLVGITHEKAVRNYIKALNKGILKVMSKMGISTLQSYCGAQIFEAVGLDKAFVDRYFTWTASRIGGIGVDVVAEEVLKRHARAFPTRSGVQTDLDWGGEYQWRRDGEYHLFNPDTVFKLQHSTRSGQYSIFKEYIEARRRPEPRPRDAAGAARAAAGRRSRFPSTRSSRSSDRPALRDRRDVVRVDQPGSARDAGDCDEPARREIQHRRGRRGSGARRARRERRLAPQRDPSGRLGPVRRDQPVPGELPTDLQIKMAQGAKPGEGGQLPGAKVYPWIAKVRYATPGVGLISPPPHHDIYSIEDLAQLIHDLKNANPQARIHVKLVALAGVGTVAAGVAKAHADVVLISGHDGGTGASPLT